MWGSSPFPFEGMPQPLRLSLNLKNSVFVDALPEPFRIDRLDQVAIKALIQSLFFAPDDGVGGQRDYGWTGLSKMRFQNLGRLEATHDWHM